MHRYIGHHPTQPFSKICDVNETFKRVTRSAHRRVGRVKPTTCTIRVSHFASNGNQHHHATSQNPAVWVLDRGVKLRRRHL